MIDKFISNDHDTALILRDLRHQRNQEFQCSYGSVASLYKQDVSCTGFMSSNPDAQIKFAQENGLFHDQITS